MKKTTEKTFLNDVKDHKLEIICDQKNTRHLRFKNPKNIYYHFDLTTWENHLCISGDMGTYVFKRTNDMFNFFRMDKEDFNHDKNKTLNINSGYWHEKLESDSTMEPAMEFSIEKFDNYLKESLNEYCKDNEMSDEFKSNCWEQIEEELLNPDSEEIARDSIESGTWPSWDNQEDQDEFASYLERDFCWGVNLKDYTNHFIWCLYAIVWGIKTYDEIKSK